MLNISKPLNSGQAQTYHGKEFTSAEQNYWKQGDTILGEWQGRLAETYGLAGAVDAQHFARLSEGQHPYTEEQLVRHKASVEYSKGDGRTVKPAEHRAGWDATFSAPKSVSLTALVGGDDRVREAHRSAVTTALSELERYTHARVGGNNAPEATGKFIAAKFEHDTARPVDGYAAPQLHTHAVIFNVTERSDGSPRALQERALFDSQQFATAVYQSELTFQLRNLGYQLETGRSGAPEIKGYSPEYLEASSLRSKQIREQLERTGHAGPAAAQIAAHNTRDGKELHTPGEVLAAHRKIAADFGDQADRVVSAARIAALAQPANRVPDPAQRAQQAVSYARDRGFEREAVSDERMLMRDALRRGMGDITYPAIRHSFDQRVAAGEFLAVQAPKHSSGRQFTTPQTIAMERNAVETLQKGQNAVEPIMSADQARSHAIAADHFNQGQRAAVEDILTSRDRVHGFQGLAGTGKTTALASIRDGAERNGYAVQGFAPTSKAAAQLREAGISADTLQGFLARGGGGSAGDPQSRHLYMLDESSLASTRQMRDFLDRIGPQDRVLVIGDTRQHQGVDAGKPFEQMQDAGMRTSTLEQIVRQRDPDLLRAVEHLAKNETTIGITLMQQQGRVTEIPDAAKRIETIAKEYAARPDGTIIVSPDNASRRELNRAVRVELQSARIVAPENHSLAILIPRSEMTGADRQWAAKYQTGDVIHYSKGSKNEGIERGSYATVTSIEAEHNRLTVRLRDGQERTYDPRRLQGISAYQEIHRDFAKGDRIQFTAPARELGVANRDLGTIQNLDGRQLTVKMDGKEHPITFDTARMRHFDHGYAVTSHSSQGITAERVLVNMDTRANPELISTRFAYVAISRASHEAQIYTNDAGNLAQRMSHDVSKTSAVDFRQAPPAAHQEKPMELTTQKTAALEQETPSKQSLPASERIYTPAELERHYAPLHAALNSEEAARFTWKAETGTVQSYQNQDTRRHIHIDGPTGQFYDQNKNPIDRGEALDRAMTGGQLQSHHVPLNDVSHSL
jgi:conjugative relaxase-like TrwC/TraI family protein